MYVPPLGSVLDTHQTMKKGNHLYRDEGLKKGFQKFEQPGSTEAQCRRIQLILDASSNCENLLHQVKTLIFFSFQIFPTSMTEAESTILVARSTRSFWLSSKGTAHSEDDRIVV